MPEREVRYCTTEDGVRIAYCLQGEGPPLVLCQRWAESFSLDSLVPTLDPFWRWLRQSNRVIRYDMRGSGLSQRDVEDVSHAGLLLDLEAVIEAASLEQFELWASRLSTPRVVEYVTRHPDKVTHLILYAPIARGADVMSEEALANYAGVLRGNWHVGAQMMTMRLETHGAEIQEAERLRRSVSGEMMARLLTENYTSADVTELLGMVQCPTLVVNRIDDRAFPFDLSKSIAASIPNARLHPLEHSVRGNEEPFFAVVDDFLGRVPRRPVSEARLVASVRTVLFTDLVGHSEMMARLGDEQGRAVLREHERITREVLRAHDGAEVKTMGDGFMASFSSVTRAVECAIALQRAFAEWNVGAHRDAPLHVRVGLNAGEPIEEAGDLFGASVIVASRVAAQAGAGEILVPEPVRHLLAGKSFVFADRGEVILKGFEDVVRLFEVCWRE